MVYFKVLPEVIIVLIIFMIFDEYHRALKMKAKKKVVCLAIVLNILLDKHVLGATLVDVFLTDVNPF